MGGGEAAQEDVIKKVTFDLNLLICGNYVESKISEKLKNKEVKKLETYEGKPYKKKGSSKNVEGWNYYLFTQDEDIGKNTLEFIQESVSKNKYNKNVIVFFTGLNEFSYKDLIEFYDKQSDCYHCFILIITKNGESILPENLNLQKLDKSLIKCIEIGEEIDLIVHLIRISSYCNQLGDEIGFPKSIHDERLLEKDHELMRKYLFTINILVCGRPGSGKSTFINKILGIKKAYAGKGSSTLTNRIAKYISDKNPIVIYDSPGYESKEDIERVQKLIKQKNESLHEEKNKIHCVFYLMNTQVGRTFNDQEIKFFSYLLDQSIDIYFIATHAQTKENAESFIRTFQLNLEQNSNGDNKLIELKNNIYPVELLTNENYKKFGIKDIFTSLYEKYKNYKHTEEITKNNINTINSIFLKDVKTKENLKKKLTALSQRIKANFKILASTLENSPFSKDSVNLATPVVKIISKIYNHSITTKECLDFIRSEGFTVDHNQTESVGRIIEKIFDCIFYVNGPSAKEVESLACRLIEKYNLELDNDKNFYGILNEYNKSINYAIDSLKEIKD